MNKRFLVLAGVAAVLSVGTFVVLNKVKPYKQEEPKVAETTSADQVFGGSVANPEAHPEGDAAAAPAPAPTETPAAAPATDSAAAVQPADTAVQPAGTDHAAAVVASTGMPEAHPDAAGGSTAPLVPASSSAAPAAAPANSTDTAAAAPAAEPAAEPAPAAEAPAPAAEEPAPAPAEKPKKHAAKNPAHAAYKAPKSESAGKAWWPAAKDNKLSLVFAGPASYKKAVVLMFNGAFFKDDGPNKNIKVTDKSGKAVSGTWELGENNLRMLVFPVTDAGTYKVSIAAGLTDNKGRKLGSKLSGPVVIH